MNKDIAQSVLPNLENCSEPSIPTLPYQELYGNLADLVLDVLTHIDYYGDHIEVGNLPKELRLRWRCQQTGQTWIINLVKVKMLGIDDNMNPITKLLYEARQQNMRAREWQLFIVQDPDLTMEIKRLGKVKAFW
jgi:hypothetical protein